MVAVELPVWSSLDICQPRHVDATPTGSTSPAWIKQQIILDFGVSKKKNLVPCRTADGPSLVTRTLVHFKSSSSPQRSPRIPSSKFFRTIFFPSYSFLRSGQVSAGSGRRLAMVKAGANSSPSRASSWHPYYGKRGCDGKSFSDSSNIIPTQQSACSSVALKYETEEDCVVWTMLPTHLRQHGSSWGEGKKDGNATGPTHLLHLPSLPSQASLSFSQPVSWPLLLYSMRASCPMSWARQGNAAAGQLGKRQESCASCFPRPPPPPPTTSLIIIAQHYYCSRNVLCCQVVKQYISNNGTLSSSVFSRRMASDALISPLLGILLQFISTKASSGDSSGIWMIHQFVDWKMLLKRITWKKTEQFFLEVAPKAVFKVSKHVHQ